MIPPFAGDPLELPQTPLALNGAQFENHCLNVFQC